MTELTFVGTGDAFGAGGRRQSAILLRGTRGTCLLDCGMTTATGLRELGISRNEIDTILISHFHGDHYGGIPTLLLAAQYADHRSEPLRIAGPVGVETRVRDLARALGYGLDDHEWNFPIQFHEYRTGDEQEIGEWSVRSFETHHPAHTCPHGLCVHDGDLRLTYSGDTGWFDGLPAEVGESDVFVTECTYLDRGFPLHLSYEEIQEHRDTFHCGRIILTHLGHDMQSMRDRCELQTADDGLTLGL
ncbi:MBL fold metallo-hydrolase [Myxococcota bacterium]|nr:MBL fold metallo-hydrolase [Myxococcota bacterium]